MSIVPMDCNTPETGSSLGISVRWGGYGINITDKSDGLGRYDSITNGLLNYQKVIAGNKDLNNATSLSNEGYIPEQTQVGGPAKQYFSIYTPSPYAGSNMNSGGYNEAYGTTEFDTGEPNLNALADFKGIVNTKIITDLATWQSDWKTADRIDNNYNSGCFPAACCCARFKTIGTKAFVDCTTDELRNGAGFWYMPSIGELGYIMPRFYDINNTISKLKSIYGVGLQIEIARDYLSSTEYNNTTVVTLETDIGAVDFVRQKTDSEPTIAFMRL